MRKKIRFNGRFADPGRGGLDSGLIYPKRPTRTVGQVITEERQRKDQEELSRRRLIDRTIR